MYALVTYNQRFYDGVTTLAVDLPAANARNILPGLEIFIKQMDERLQALGDAIRGGRLRAELPAFDASLGAAHVYIREPTATYTAAAATEPSDRPNDDAIRGSAALSSELSRLADEVVGMSKAVNLAESPQSKP